MNDINTEVKELEFEKQNLLQAIKKLKIKITDYETELIGVTERLRALKEKQLEDNK